MNRGAMRVSFNIAPQLSRIVASIRDLLCITQNSFSMQLLFLTRKVLTSYKYEEVIIEVKPIEGGVE